ncbi:MAG: hypothetical protein IKY89_05460 [Alistipes sp.]|nr:hypothetical protein [Alistipes sp.]
MNTKYDLRPCYIVKTTRSGRIQREKGIFHCWEHIGQVIEPSPLKGGHPGGQIAFTRALVETIDGCMRSVAPSSIEFRDTGNVLHQMGLTEYFFEEEDEA